MNLQDSVGIFSGISIPIPFLDSEGAAFLQKFL